MAGVWLLVLAFAVVTGVLATWLLYEYGTWLAAFFGVFTIAYYVGFYTMWLKRRTPYNIVIGGAAGATAPLILAETVVPAGVGVALLGDSLPAGSWPLLAVALVLAMGGAVWLSGFEARVEGRVTTDAGS